MIRNQFYPIPQAGQSVGFVGVVFGFEPDLASVLRSLFSLNFCFSQEVVAAVTAVTEIPKAMACNKVDESFIVQILIQGIS